MIDDQPPDFSDPRMTLNFDEFHPLDHGLIDCLGYPGGRRRHLEFRWQFQWRDWLYAKTMCRLGQHEIVRMWRRPAGADEMQVFRACRTCLAPPNDAW